MIKACILTFNDEPTIRFALSSLVGYVDDIIVIDGPFNDYSPDLGSTDGTIDIVESFGAKVIQGRYKTQVDKRNAYIKACNNNDWMIVIDSDEFLGNGYALNNIEENDYPVRSIATLSVEYSGNLYPGAFKANGILTSVPKINRLVKKSVYTRYYARHYYILIDDIHCSWTLRNVPKNDAYICHIHILRPYMRKEEKFEWYKERLENPQTYEGRGHYSFWLFDECWRNCIAFPDNEGIDYKCVSLVNNICHAYPGNFDCRGNKTIGPLIL